MVILTSLKLLNLLINDRNRSGQRPTLAIFLDLACKSGTENLAFLLDFFFKDASLSLYRKVTLHYVQLALIEHLLAQVAVGLFARLSDQPLDRFEFAAFVRLRLH